MSIHRSPYGADIMVNHSCYKQVATTGLVKSNLIYYKEVSPIEQENVSFSRFLFPNPIQI